MKFETNTLTAMTMTMMMAASPALITANATPQLVRFQESAQRHLQSQADQMVHTIITNNRHELRRRQLEGDSSGTVCSILLPLFDYAMENTIENENDGCTCTGTLQTTLDIQCSFLDVCDDERLWLGTPICATKVAVGYTLSFGADDEPDTEPPPASMVRGGSGMLGGLDYSLTSHACVDMSNPPLPEYCMTFDLTTDSQTCTTTLDTQECVCDITIDSENPDQSCWNVDCSGVDEDWPPSSSSEGGCQNPLEMTDAAGGSIETTSFLLAFDEPADAADGVDGSDAAGTAMTQTGLLLLAGSAATAIWTAL